MNTDTWRKMQTGQSRPFDQLEQMMITQTGETQKNRGMEKWSEL